MSIEALALLRLSDLAPREGDDAPTDVIVLSDAVLVRTGASFAAEPHELAAGLRRMLGEKLDAHEDERGIFFVPGVALEPARSAGGYHAVIEAIGEAGMWVALVEDVTTARPTMVEALMARAMEGEEIDPEVMQGAVRASLAQMAEAFSTGEEDEIAGEGTSPGVQAPIDLAALLGDPAMRALLEKMKDFAPPDASADDDDDDDRDDDDDDDGDDETDGSGTELDGAVPPGLEALLASPAFAQMLANARDLLDNNPEEAQRIAARLGLAITPPGDDEE